MLPFFKAIPANAIYPILVIVGVLMFGELAHINFDDFAIKASTFFIVLMMPLTYSITNGLAFGFVAYLFIKLIKREFKDIDIGVVVLALISSLIFFL